jgi:hypothetical protein
MGPLRSAVLVLALALVSACDSGLDTPPLFEALEGTWALEGASSGEALQFGPHNGFALVSEGAELGRGRVSLASEGGASDLTGLIRITYTVQTGPSSSSTTWDEVVSSSPDVLVLEGCVLEALCEGAARRTYRRVL